MKETLDRKSTVIRRLLDAYPNVQPHLRHHDSFQLLVATMLSARCTDERVNSVTPLLFARFPSAAALALADLEELERIVRPTGFYRQKARALKAAAAVLVERHAGMPPRTIEELARLPGVGRKTASAVAGLAHGAPAIIVDTHLARVTRRLGLASSENPRRIESELKALVPESVQTRFSMAVNEHGRTVCRARRALCAQCPVSQLCPWPGRAAAGPQQRPADPP